MSRVRRLAAFPIAVAIGGVLLAATPAWATTATWNSPTDNSTFTTTNPIDFSVTLSRSLLDSSTVNLTLAVPGPNPGPFTRDTSSGSDPDLKFTFTPACPNQTGSCAAGSPPAYNGIYTAGLNGGASGTHTIRLQVPPAAPTGVTATAAGTHRVRVAWAANREPDLTGYDVFTGDGTTVATNLPKDTTAYEFDLPSSGYGGTHTYVVRAHRLQCANCGTAPGSDTVLDSPVSEPASVTFDEPGYTASPTPAPTTSGDGTTTSGGDYNGNGGGNNGNGNGNGNGGNGGSTSTATADPSNQYNDGTSGGSYSSGSKPTAEDQRRAFGLVFKSFAPKIGAPKLPPLPQFSNREAPLPWGTYNPTLNYGDKTTTEKQRIAGDQSVTSQLVDTVTAAFEGRKLYRSIAIALLLLLAAGHLRLWLRKPYTG